MPLWGVVDPRKDQLPSEVIEVNLAQYLRQRCHPTISISSNHDVVVLQEIQSTSNQSSVVFTGHHVDEGNPLRHQQAMNGLQLLVPQFPLIT